MYKLFKWVGGALLSVALLVLIAMIIIPAVIEPNDYRDELTALVKEKTGRDLRLEGDLSISVFPWLGIHSEGLHLAQPDAIGGEMLNVESAQLRVRLIPLFSKRVEVDTVVLEKASIRLVTTQNGVRSWSDLTASNGQESGEREAPKPIQASDQDTPSNAAEAAVALIIQGVRLSESSVVWEDRQAGTRIEITQLDLETGNIIGETLADFAASGRIAQSELKPAAKPTETDFNLGARVKVNRATFAAEIERLRVELQRSEQSIQLEADSIAISPQQIISVFGASGTSSGLLSGVQKVQFSVPDATLNMAQQTLELPKLVVAIANLNAVLSEAKITQLADAPKLNGQLAVSEFNARKLLSALPIDYSPVDSRALNALSLNALVAADLDSISLTKLEMMMDESRLSGSLSVSDFANPTPAFDLSIDTLNIDRYLPASSSTETASVVAAEKTGAEALAGAMAAFYALNANGRFRANALVASKVALVNLDVTLAAKSSGNQPRIKAQLEVPEFNARPLLEDFAPDYVPARPSALKAVAFKATLVGDESSIGLQQLAITADDSRLVGTASLRNFSSPALQFDLSLDSLNVDHYLPMPAVSADSRGEQVSGGDVFAIPMAAFHAINANGQFRAKQLMAGGVQLTGVDVLVSSNDGNVSITPSAALYQGKLGGQVTYQEQSGQAELRVKQSMDLVQLGELLSDADITDQLRGIGRLDVDVRVTERDGKQSNQGEIKLVANNGALTGIDLVSLLSQVNTVANLLSKGEQEQADAQVDSAVDGKVTDITQFGELLGTFTLNDFLLRNDDFKLVTPVMEVTGFGDINLANQTLDYNVRIAVQNGLSGAIGSRLAKLQGYTIPVRCRGSLNAPSCRPDAKALYAAYAKSKLDLKKGELLKEKYGIEGGEKLSTSEALTQILLQKALNKNKPKGDSEPPASEPNDSQPASNSSSEGASESSSATRASQPPSLERPISERQSPPIEDQNTDKGANQGTDQAFSNVPVSAEPEAPKSTEPVPETKPELNEKQKRREERKQLLERLLNPDGNS